VIKTAIVAAAIGGSFAVVEGLLLIVLGSLAGLAENPEGEAAMTDGFVVLALGVVVLASVFVARRRPLVLAVVTAVAAAVGFLVENALWVFAAAFLLAAAAFAVISKRGDVRFATRNSMPL
jgi:hypothetical protein